MQKLKAAMLYAEMGFSVIPCKKDKKPLVAWTKYQTERSGHDQIKAWWSKWPDANPAIVTGGISGIDVLDADSESGRGALEEFLPDSIIIPTVKTPKGYHFYFKHSLGLTNGTQVIIDCDLRAAGGYVLAPPGHNEAGQYKWTKGLKITDGAPPEMPRMLFDILKNSGRNSGASSSEHIKNDVHSIDKNSLSREGATFQKNQTATSATYLLKSLAGMRRFFISLQA